LHVSVFIYVCFFINFLSLKPETKTTQILTLYQATPQLWRGAIIFKQTPVPKLTFKTKALPRTKQLTSRHWYTLCRPQFVLQDHQYGVPVDSSAIGVTYCTYAPMNSKRTEEMIRVSSHPSTNIEQW